MQPDRTVSRGFELGRWLLVAAVLLIGLGLYLAFAPHSDPPAPSIEHEGR